MFDKQNIGLVNNEKNSLSSLFSHKMDFSSRRTWVIMAVAIIIVLVIGALIWCYTNRQTNEAFSSMRSSSIQTACRIHQVFLPNADGGVHPLYKLHVVNRINGKSKIVGPSEKKFKRRIGQKHHLHSYEEAKVGCMRNSRFAGFVLITSNAAIHPEHITDPNQVNQRYPTLFFEAADESEFSPINRTIYEQQPSALRQHVYKLYPRLDKCKDDHFCRFPFHANPEKLGLTEIMDDVSLAQTSLKAARRYCAAERQNNPDSTLVGFTCEREGSKVLKFYECQTDLAKDYHFEEKWMELGEDSNQKSMIDSNLVFYSYSEDPCRETVADDDFMVQLRDWTRDWESEGAKIHPMLSEKEVKRRICKDDAEAGKYDYNCFLNEADTLKVQDKLMKGDIHAYDAAHLALDNAPEMDDEEDPFKIYKDANNKLYFRQRDRCCENRIGHSGTLPEGASERVHEVVSATVGCNADMYSGSFFNEQCNTACKQKVGEDTPIYRKDLGRCVPEEHKCIPNRTVCNDDVLRTQFDEVCPTSCSKTCGINDIDKDRGFQRLHYYPDNTGEDGEHITDIATYPEQSLDNCQVRCDASEDCDLFKIKPCSTSSDVCRGTCTLQKRSNKTAHSGELKLSQEKIEPRTRMYAKTEYDINDPHVNDFYKRNNYCRLDGQPYYHYVVGADYAELVQLEARVKNDPPDAVGGNSAQSVTEPFTPYTPEIEIKEWNAEDATYTTEDSSKVRLDSYYPALRQGTNTTGETINFRNDVTVVQSRDGTLRATLLLQFNKNTQITHEDVQKMIEDDIGKNYTVVVERVVGNKINRFKCTVEVGVQNENDTSNEQSMLTQALNAIEIMKANPPFVVLDKFDMIYESDSLKLKHMDVTGTNMNAYVDFALSNEEIKAKRTMTDSEELKVCFNNLKTLTGQGETLEFRFHINIDDNSPARAFVDLVLKPFSNDFTYYNGMEFPLYLNNKYIQLKSGTYTMRLSSMKKKPEILLIHEDSNKEHEWLFVPVNLFHFWEKFAPIVFYNISLCFRVQNLMEGESIKILKLPFKY